MLSKRYKALHSDKFRLNLLRGDKALILVPSDCQSELL